MQRLIPVIALSLFCSAALAAPKPCEELKEEIAATLTANGVGSYTLTVVENEEVDDVKKVVGSCNGGTEKIIYTRG